jgi:hypothetical protein
MVGFPRILTVLAGALAACAIAAPAASADTPGAHVPRTAAAFEPPMSSAPERRSSPARVRARAASPVSLLGRLLARVIYRARPVATSFARRYARRAVVNWTKRQVIEWYCGQWYRYFGYDARLWRWAAHHYPSAWWSWNYCLTSGY